MEFGGRNVELDDGVVFMMSGGGPRHAAIAANLIIAFGTRLHGSGCRPYGSDMAVRTGPQLIRFPDVSIVRRSGPQGWADDWLPAGRAPGLPMLAIEFSPDEIFTID